MCVAGGAPTRRRSAPTTPSRVAVTPPYALLLSYHGCFQIRRGFLVVCQIRSAQLDWADSWLNDALPSKMPRQSRAVIDVSIEASHTGTGHDISFG